VVNRPVRKSDVTRARILQAANRRFREQGYEAATAAAIAADAGVTERTFFRYFPKKSDVLVANWQLHADALYAALAHDNRADLAKVVGAALRAFTDRLSAELEDGVNSVILLWLDHEAFLAIIPALLRIEEDLARAIARRAGRAENDFLVRVSANASFGVFRAAIRASALDPGGPSMGEMIDDGLRQLRGVFRGLQNQRTD
jgi:AcrR family transcriptional regulator